MDRERKPRSTKPKKTAPRLSIARPDFVDSFCEAAKNLISPAIFSKWGAIAAVAGALERKVWVYTMNDNLYPNMYVILVSDPGLGKGVITWRIREMWQKLDDHFVASSSVTKAAMMDELAEANRRWITNDLHNPVEHFNSLLICSNELGVLLPSYDNEFMNALQDLWDCKDYSEKRRHRRSDPITIKKVQLNMLAACTPSYLMHMMPEGAWDQGFISRTILVFSGEYRKKSLFADYGGNSAEREFLQDQIASIANVYGEIKFTEKSAELTDNFHMEISERIKPTHPKLRAYTMRRSTHLLKLSMVASMSRSNEKIIQPEDYHRALDWLIEVEQFMPDIFKAVATGGTGKIMEDAWYFVFTMYAKSQKPVLEHKLIQFLQERVPVHYIKQTIQMMEEGKMLERSITKIGAAYIPLGKR